MEFYPFQFFHVSNRSVSDESIFRSAEDYQKFLALYTERCSQYVESVGYCLNPHEFHVLVYVCTLNLAALADAFASVQGLYRKYFNKKYDCAGRCFSRNEQAYVLTDEVSAIRLLTALHQLPERLNLCKDMEEWPYSSYRHYLDYPHAGVCNTDRLRNYFLSTAEFQRFSTMECVDIRSFSGEGQER